MEKNQVNIMEDTEICLLSTPELAYLGDSVYETCIRRKVLSEGVRGAKELNLASQSYVSANAQAEIYQKLSPLFTEDEQKVANRGRNAKHKNSPKNAGLSAYRLATALECVFGYLYLKGRQDRILELIEQIS